MITWRNAKGKYLCCAVNDTQNIWQNSTRTIALSGASVMTFRKARGRSFCLAQVRNVRKGRRPMTNQDRLLSDLRNLKYDRLAIQIMHDDIVRLNDDIVGQRYRDVETFKTAMDMFIIILEARSSIKKW